MPSFNSKFSLIKRDAVFCKKYHIDWASILCKNAFFHKIESQSLWYFLQNTASLFINENLELKEGITLYAIGAFC